MHIYLIFIIEFPFRKNGAAATRELLKGDPDAHNFQEYTYKKITPCDVCSQVLRGRQTACALFIYLCRFSHRTHILNSMFYGIYKAPIQFQNSEKHPLIQ